MHKPQAANQPYKLPPPLFDARCKACWFTTGLLVLVVASFWSLDLQWAQFLSLEAAASLGRFVAEFFPPDLSGPFVQKVLVGAGFVNTAKKGQAVNNQRVWGKHAAFLFIDSEAALANQPCWGFSAQWGGRTAGTLAEPKMGMRGSERVRVGESLKEVVAAPALGYFFQNAVA